MPSCTEPGCSRPARSARSGVCQACYRRKRRRTDPAVAEAARASVRRAATKRGGKPVLPRHERFPGTDPEVRAAQKRAADRKRHGAPSIAERRVGECEICSGWADPLCLDHDHSTGELRGWLCRQCNASLGGFKDSAQLLERALRYLAK